MAARKNKSKSSSATEQLLAQLNPYQREIAGGILLLFTIITLLSLF